MMRKTVVAAVVGAIALAAVGCGMTDSITGGKDSSGGLITLRTKSISYSSAGPDGAWFTNDDAVSSWAKYTYDASGKVIKSVSFNGVGPDGVRFTTDDIVSARTEYTENASGCRTRYVTYSATGAVSGWANLSCDSGNRTSKAVRYNGAGADGAWMTGDDVIGSVTTYEYNSAGKQIKAISYGPGPDLVLNTPDDVIASVYVTKYDSNNLMLRSYTSTNPGLDGIWDTQDDTLSAFWSRYDNDAFNRLSRSISYSGVGADGIQFTSDDPVGSYMDSLYN